MVEMAFDAVAELPALAALKVSCAANDETPPARARSARSRAAFPDAGASGATGVSSREDTFEFAGTSPTPATLGVSPLSASPVPGDARWGLEAATKDGKTSHSKISPVSVLMVPALDLSVSFEDEAEDDAMDVAENERFRGFHESAAAPFAGSATFGASASFKLRREGERAEDDGEYRAERLEPSRQPGGPASWCSPRASPVSAHPSAGFGTPAGVGAQTSVNAFGSFDAVPPTPARPRKLDAFEDPFEEKDAFGDALEDDDAWQLSDDSDDAQCDDKEDAEMRDVPPPFSLFDGSCEPEGEGPERAGGTPLEMVARECADDEDARRTSRKKNRRRPPARFRAPRTRLERADSLSQTKLLAQAGLHRSASLRADYGREVHDRPREATDSFSSDRSPAEPSSEPSSSTSSAFTFHDHFEFKSLLGKTATSEAWLVRSKVSGHKYCVKRVTEAFRTTSQRETCLQEVRAVTNLPAHENVVKYHRAWQEDRHFFAQMELCERGAFGACLDRLKSMSEEERRTKDNDGGVAVQGEPYVALLAERDVWRFASDVASGLAHCHAHGVLHLDVKPDNVFIARDGVYKIGDFGVAWVAGKGWEVQDGDGGYVAPETLNLYRRTRDYGEEEEKNSDPSERDGSEPTDRADVFSFGATLYEAACGERVPAEWRRGVPTWSDEDETARTVGLETCPAKTEPEKTQTTKPRRYWARRYWDGLRFPNGRSDELRAYVSMCLRRDPTHRPSAADLAKHAAMIEKTFVSS